MKYRRFPRTEITVSEVGMALGPLLAQEARLRDPAEAQSLLQRALDLGITLFSVADYPTDGEEEVLLATALGRRRHNIIISASGGYDWYTPAHKRPAAWRGNIGQDWSPAYVRKACEASLERLHSDYIDLYLLHHPGVRALESEELFDILPTLRKEGKIRAYGVILGPRTAWKEEGEIVLKERKAVAAQAVYSILQQKPARFLFSLAAKMESGVIAEDPLAEGALLAGFGESADARLRELAFLGRNYDMTMPQVALKFALADPAVVSTLPPLTREERLAELAAVPDLPPLAPADFKQLQDLYDAGFGVRA